MLVRLVKIDITQGQTILTSFLILWGCPCQLIATYSNIGKAPNQQIVNAPKKTSTICPKSAVSSDLFQGVGNPLNVCETPEKLHNTRLDYSNQLYDTLGMSLTVFSNLYSHLKSPKSSNFSMPQKRHSLKPTFRKIFKWIYKEWATL